MKRIYDVEILDTVEELVDPAYTVVLVIDMQNEVVGDGGGFAKHGYDISRIKGIIPTIRNVLEAGRRLNLPIIYAEFVNRNRFGGTLMDGPNWYVVRDWKWVADTVQDSWESKTVDALAPQPGEVVIQKTRPSVIYNTYLDNILKTRGIRSVVLMGCLTDGCVLQTAVGVMHHGYYPVIIRNCVDSFTAQAHDLGLRWMEKEFPVFTSEEVLAAWTKSRGKTTELSEQKEY